ncbi:glutamine amidotransferase, partial [Streptomyces sp. NPDC005811]|uniref:glutamine amidotransferase n=1 Tax=Streptomyces sp. NPDC005811 TaxID=3154565 RepID=UPI0033D5E00B
GAGRSAAFTSDLAPHWAPPGFLAWDCYPVLWDRLVRWLSGETLPAAVSVQERREV